MSRVHCTHTCTHLSFLKKWTKWILVTECHLHGFLFSNIKRSRIIVMFNQGYIVVSWKKCTLYIYRLVMKTRSPPILLLLTSRNSIFFFCFKMILLCSLECCCKSKVPDAPPEETDNLPDPGDCCTVLILLTSCCNDIDSGWLLFQIMLSCLFSE